MHFRCTYKFPCVACLALAMQHPLKNCRKIENSEYSDKFSSRKFCQRTVLSVCNFFLRDGNVPTHVRNLTQVVTSVYLGHTHLGTPFQVSAWVRKFSLGSTRDDYFFGDVTCHQFRIRIWYFKSDKSPKVA